MIASKLLTLAIFINFLLHVKCELRSTFSGSVPEYNYEITSRFGVDNWGDNHESCLGNLQSPINFNSKSRSQETVYPLILENFNLLPYEIEMTNDGQTVEMIFNYAFGKNATITSRLLDDEVYIVHSLHFHWGESNDIGSEHTVDFQRYSGEIHVVSYNSKYRNIREARSMKKGIVVLASFMTTEDTKIPNDLAVMYYTRNYSPSMSSNFYLTQLPKLRELNSTVYLRDNEVVSLYDVIKGSVVSYYSYRGSFTTPNCEETVTWLVNRLPVRVRSVDLSNFRKIKGSSGNTITRNYRGIQFLNNRKILKYSSLQ